jgi:hypothetical protein
VPDTRNYDGKHGKGGICGMVLYAPAAILFLIAALLLSGCDPEESDGGDRPKPRPTAGVKKEPLKPNPTVNVPGPVQGDPNACDGGGTAELKGAWVSENRKVPTIEYSIGAGQIPATNLKSNKSSNGYNGLWVLPVTVKCGQTIGFSLFGQPGFTFVECYVWYKGQVHNYQGTIENKDPRNCASHLTIPG